MAPLLSIKLGQDEQRQLPLIARQSIQRGLDVGTALQVELDSLPPALLTPMGVFVTLTSGGSLKGCIGSMESTDPLAQAVADNAYAAAFRDHRFAPLQATELADTDIEISILSPMVPLRARDRAHLLDTLRPGTDGLLLEDGHHRSTFLPAVWQQLSSPESFFDHLLSKAGLATDHWSPSLRLYRYETLCLSEHEVPCQSPGGD